MYSGYNADPEIKWQTIAECSLAAEPGCECAAVEQVEQAIRRLGLAPAHLNRCTQTVSEAFANAAWRARVTQSGGRITLRVLTTSGNMMTEFHSRPAEEAASAPDSPAAGVEMPPRGWGFFLLEKTAGASEAGDGTAPANLVIELFLYLEGTR